MMPPPNPFDPLLREMTWLANYCARLPVDRATGEDVAQATLLAALQHELDPGCSPRPWLGAVARNFARQWMRSRSMEAQVLTRLGESGESPPAEVSLERGEEQRRIQAQVEELRELHARVVSMRYLEGLAVGQIARRLGCPTATVKSRLRRGLVELRSRLVG